MKDLGRRVAVAVVAIPIVLGLVYLGGWFVALPLAGFAGWGTHEAFRFARERQLEPIGWVGVALAVSFVILAGWRPTFGAFAPFALAALMVGGLIAALEVMRLRGPEGRPLSATAVTVFAGAYVGLPLAFGPLLLALPEARGWSRATADPLAALAIMVLPLVATWVGDAAAYFAGSAWGKAKLAPSISPNKSWVGFWANVAGAGVAGVLWSLAVGPVVPGLVPGMPLWFLVVGAILGLVAVMGDLLESLFKREAGVKDSGTFFPGHGGVLDRIDSLLFTIPSAYGLLLLVEFVR